MINQKDEAFNRCWSKYYKEHSWNYMDEELSSDLAYYFWKSALEQPTNMVTIPLDKLEDMQRRLKPKEWQRLSDDEILDIKVKAGLGNWYDFSRAIETKLKEKNT